MQDTCLTEEPRGRVLHVTFNYSWKSRGVVYLTAFSIAHIIWRRMMAWLVDNKLGKCGRKLLWPNSRHYPGICLKSLRKNTKNVRTDGLRPDIWARVTPDMKQGCQPNCRNDQWRCVDTINRRGTLRSVNPSTRCHSHATRRAMLATPPPPRHNTSIQLKPGRTSQHATSNTFDTIYLTQTEILTGGLGRQFPPGRGNFCFSSFWSGSTSAGCNCNRGSKDGRQQL
jgi:hypothetical protein